MGNRPKVEGIVKLLRDAQETTDVVLMEDGRPTVVEMDVHEPPRNSFEANLRINLYTKKGEWRTDGPDFQRLQDWVEIHWNPSTERQVPQGTIATADSWGREYEIQLDSANATRKLIAAAKIYGSEAIGKCAIEFATHGMIEVHTLYLLKGPALDETKVLDEYCTLRPYRDVYPTIKQVWELGPSNTADALPSPELDNVCALECRHFERNSAPSKKVCTFMSPLHLIGIEALVLLLGLVWGCGFRVFMNCHGVPAPIDATLPFRMPTSTRGTGSSRTSLDLVGYGPSIRNRPLAVAELHALAIRYSELSEKDRLTLRSSMMRLRDSTERIDQESRFIDIGIGLQQLLIDEEQIENQTALITRRAAWLYADSKDERIATANMIRRFFDHYFDIVNGRMPHEPNAEQRELSNELFIAIDDVLRAILKLLVEKGIPQDWEKATDDRAFYRDPPRLASEIPSQKSDSLSWSIVELEEIDRSLKAMWELIVDEAPLPPPGEGSTMVGGHSLDQAAASYREKGIPYVAIHPARLYMVHPKWARQEDE